MCFFCFCFVFLSFCGLQTYADIRIIAVMSIKILIFSLADIFFFYNYAGRYGRHYYSDTVKIEKTNTQKLKVNIFFHQDNC